MERSIKTDEYKLNHIKQILEDCCDDLTPSYFTVKNCRNILVWCNNSVKMISALFDRSIVVLSFKTFQLLTKSGYG